MVVSFGKGVASGAAPLCTAFFKLVFGFDAGDAVACVVSAMKEN